VEPSGVQGALLKKDVFPIHGEYARYIAIESKPRSRKIYARHEISCFWVTQEGHSLTNGTHIVKRHLP
jgi:hypothetical protein